MFTFQESSDGYSHVLGGLWCVGLSEGVGCYHFLPSSEKVSSAHDALEVEENHIVQSLSAELPEEYDVIGK